MEWVLPAGDFPVASEKAFTRVNDRSGRAIEDVEAKLIADPVHSAIPTNSFPQRDQRRSFFPNRVAIDEAILCLSGDNKPIYNGDSIEFAKDVDSVELRLEDKVIYASTINPPSISDYNQ